MIKNGQARRYDIQTGQDRGTVGTSNAKVAASDGEYIVIVYNNGQARRYMVNTGNDLGYVGIPSSTAINCSISNGIIILTYSNGESRKYEARTGVDKGRV